MSYAVIALCSILFAWGGYNLNIMRRYGIPLVLALYALLLTHAWQSVGLLLAIPCLSAGYGDKSQFRHVFGDSWGRGVWSLIVGVSLGLPLLLTGHLGIIVFVPYLIASFFIEPLCKNLYQVAGDLIIGAVLASFVLFIH